MPISIRDNKGRYNGTEKIYTDDDLIAALQIAKAVLGKTPTFDSMKKIAKAHNLPHPVTLQKRFGSWENSLMVAGMQSNQYYARDFLVAEIERFIEEYEHVPSTNEFRYAKDYPGIKAYRRIFGSFNNALVELGYTPVSVAKSNKYCCTTLAKDGHLCDSREEAMVDDFLFTHNMPHSIQPLYPRHPELNIKGYIRADFLLEKDSVFVEYAGLINRKFYAKKLELKQQLATAVGIKLFIVYPSDLSNLEKAFGRLQA